LPKLKPSSRLVLNNGVRIPVIGLGTWKLTGERCYRAVLDALDMGYRLIDTASTYNNEDEIGRAVQESGKRRRELFITTKVGIEEQGYVGTMAAFERSLARLDMDHIDLYLIHWPVSDKSLETWRAMEDLLETGRCRSIGVSNYDLSQIDELLQRARTVPTIEQIEFNPFVNDLEIINYCKDKGIRIEAYSPLTHGNRLQERVIMELAEGYGKRPAQIMIRWALQKGAIAIPKATSRGHLRENLDVFDFELFDGDMVKLDALDTTSCMIDRA
jgi:diketogulonate reductase-like aldo/keto reductase